MRDIYCCAGVGPRFWPSRLPGASRLAVPPRLRRRRGTAPGARVAAGVVLGGWGLFCCSADHLSGGAPRLLSRGASVVAMRVVAGSPRAMRAVSRAALSPALCMPLCVAKNESFCLNSGRIEGAARGRVARARSCPALGVCKRAGSHRASGVRALASNQASLGQPSSRHKASTPTSSEDVCHSRQRLNAIAASCATAKGAEAAK